MNATKTKQTNKTKTISAPKPHHRSIPILVALAFLLTISIVGIFVINSLKTTSLEVATASAHSKVYLTIECQNNSSTCLEETEKLREQHNGKTLGSVKLYQAAGLGSYYLEISADAASEFLFADLNSVPKDKIPALIPNDINPKELNSQFVPVGIYSGSVIDEANLHHAGIFTPIFEQITAQPQPIYAINNGTSQTDKPLVSEKQIIVFDSYKKVLSYQHDAEKVKHASVADIFSNVLEINHVFNDALVILYWLTGFVALLTVAAIVDVILSSHR